MKKKGISLITLVVTIIVIVIIAGAVILSLSNNNPIGNANKAVVMQNMDTFKSELAISIANKVANQEITSTSQVNLSNEDILEYIPSMENKKVEGKKYTDILTISNGKLSLRDNAQIDENLESMILSALNGETAEATEGKEIEFQSTSITKKYGEDDFTNRLKYASRKSVTYESSDETVATINETTGVVTIVGLGTTTITASVVEPEETATYTLTVEKGDGSITFEKSLVEKRYGNSNFTNTLTKVGDGTITGYTSSNTDVATVSSSGEVTIVEAGTTTITPVITDGDKYSYGSLEGYTLKVYSSVTYTVGTNSSEVQYVGTNGSPIVSSTVLSLSFSEFIYTDKEANSKVASGNVGALRIIGKFGSGEEENILSTVSSIPTGPSYTVLVGIYIKASRGDSGQLTVTGLTGGPYYDQYGREIKLTLDEPILFSNIIAKTNPPVLESLEITSPGSGTYATDQEITITATFDVDVYYIYSSNKYTFNNAYPFRPYIKIKFENGNEKETTFSSVSGNVLTYTYTIASDDRGKIVSARFEGPSNSKVCDVVGNSVTIGDTEITGSEIIANQ